MRRRSGSLGGIAVVAFSSEDELLLLLWGEDADGGDVVYDGGMEVVAESSVSMRSWVMSCACSFWDCDISASVRIRSTRVSRPSVEERRRILRVSRRGAVVGLVPLVVEEGEIVGGAG